MTTTSPHQRDDFAQFHGQVTWWWRAIVTVVLTVGSGAIWTAWVDVMETVKSLEKLVQLDEYRINQLETRVTVYEKKVETHRDEYPPGWLLKFLDRVELQMIPDKPTQENRPLPGRDR